MRIRVMEQVSKSASSITVSELAYIICLILGIGS
jgi:hypothetical protein